MFVEFVEAPPKFVICPEQIFHFFKFFFLNRGVNMVEREYFLLLAEFSFRFFKKKIKFQLLLPILLF